MRRSSWRGVLVPVSSHHAAGRVDQHSASLFFAASARRRRWRRVRGQALTARCMQDLQAPHPLAAAGRSPITSGCDAPRSSCPRPSVLVWHLTDCSQQHLIAQSPPPGRRVNMYKLRPDYRRGLADSGARSVSARRAWSFGRAQLVQFLGLDQDVLFGHTRSHGRWRRPSTGRR